MIPTAILRGAQALAIAFPLQAALAQSVRTEAYSFDRARNGNLAFQDFFTHAMDLSDDILVCGAFASHLGQGEVTIFERVHDGWIRGAVLQASSPQGGTRYGGSVSVSGERVAVGAALYDGPFLQSGRVYIYERHGGHWQETAILEASDPSHMKRFGGGVALDGDRLLVGAPLDDQVGPSAGAAYVFDFDGNTWRERAKLLPPPGVRVVGWSVELVGDTAVINSLVNYSNAGLIYQRGGAGWNLVQTVGDSTSMGFDDTGWSLAFDGETIVIGQPIAYGAWPMRHGAALVFERTGPSSWGLVQELRASDGNISSGITERFGESVAVLGDRILVGAAQAAGSAGQVGRAYLFERGPAGWVEVEHFEHSEPLPYEMTGKSVSLIEGLAMVGSRFALVDGVKSGEALAFPLPLGEVVCSSPPASTGQTPELRVDGSPLASLASLWLSAEGLPPGRPSLFLASLDGQAFPFFGGGQGTSCLGAAPLSLWPVQEAAPDGTAHLELPNLPLLAGQRWHFQCWFRDTNPTPTSNLSEAVAIDFR